MISAVGGIGAEQWEDDFISVGGIGVASHQSAVQLADLYINLIEPSPTVFIESEYGFVANVNFVEPAASLGIVTEVLFAKKTVSKRHWFFTLKGGVLDDIVIPISSFSESMRYPSVAIYYVVVPDGERYADDISDRSDGVFFITSREIYIDGTFDDTDTSNIQVDSIRIDQGGNNFSITIIGKSLFENIAPIKLNVDGVSFRSLSFGAQIIRCENNKDFRGGDVAILPGGEQVKIGTVTRIIGSNVQTMQLRELSE